MKTGKATEYICPWCFMPAPCESRCTLSLIDPTKVVSVEGATFVSGQPFVVYRMAK